MASPPTVAPKPCCVCGGPGGQHCTDCKSRHYCGKPCQLVDWRARGHKAQCKQMASDFQDRLVDSLLAKLQMKEAISDDVSPAACSKARLPAGRTQTMAVVEANAVNDDAPHWRGTCAICLDLLPIGGAGQTLYLCCCKKICTECSNKCVVYDVRCPLCRAPASTSEAEQLRRLLEQVDKGNAEAQVQLGGAYREGMLGLKKSVKRALQLYELVAAQGHPVAQINLGACYQFGNGVKIHYETAAMWYRRAAEQVHPLAQSKLGYMFFHGKGVTQSYDEAVKWFRLAAAQGDGDALYNLGLCHANGDGVPQDYHEALRLYKIAAAKGDACAAAAVEDMQARLDASESNS